MARREFVGRLIAAGPTRTLSGEAGRYVMTAEAVRRAVEEGLFRGLACFVDHSAGRPSLRRLVGVWHGVTWDEAGGAAVGRLRTFETATTRPVIDLLAQSLGEAEPPDVGVSLVFYPRLAADGRTVTEIVMVESADVVMFPASAASRIVAEAERPGEAGAQSKGEGSGRGNAARAGERGGAGERAAAYSPWDGTTRVYRLVSHSDKELVMSATMENEMQQERDRDERERAEREAPAAGRGAVSGSPGGARRVRLVARAGSGANEDVATPLPVAETAAAGDDLTAAWRRAAAGMVIRAAGLPGPVQERLLRGQYDTVADVEAAVAAARAELAALNEAGVVRLDGIGGRGAAGVSPGGARRVRLRDGLDEARDLVAFFFGAAGAPEPPPNLRSFADLYVALTGDVHFRGVFDSERAQFSGATTATLPNLAVDAMNRVIVQQFQALEHYRWYERISTAEPNDGTLQDMKWITLGGVGDLPAVNEGAAYTELSISDVKETAAFVKRGGYVGITREMIKNSNILQLQAIPRALAAAAVRTRSAAVAALFTANSGVGPTLAQDSKALFHADHGNLAMTALGTDAAAWRVARAECFQQTEVGSGKALGIFPRYLLVPAELYDTALSILGYGEGMPAVYTPEAVGRGFADPRPIPLVVPDWTDSADWAYVVDPAVFPVIQMSYSQAPGGRRHPIPELFAVVSETSGLMFSNDILPIKVRDEFALGVNGHRGIGKRNVSE